MLVYRLCMSVLLTCELHLIGLSQINTRWSVTSPVLTHCLRDYVNAFSMICLLPVVFMLLVQVQVIDWKDQLLRMTLSYNLLMTTLSLTHSHHLLSSRCTTVKWPCPAWAAPRILRWEYKTGFASEKKIVPPTFPNVGVQASKYQYWLIQYIEICCLVVALINIGRPRPMLLWIRERYS